MGAGDVGFWATLQRYGARGWRRRRSCVARAVRRRRWDGRIRAPCVIRGVSAAKGPLPGKIFALCIPERRFAGLFGYMARISCQSQLVLDARRRYVAREGRFSRPGPLRGCTKRKNCHDKASENASEQFLATASRLRTHRARILPRTAARERTTAKYRRRRTLGGRNSRASCHRRVLGDASRLDRREGCDTAQCRCTIAPKTKEGERSARLLSLFNFTTRVARGPSQQQATYLRNHPLLGIPCPAELRFTSDSPMASQRAKNLAHID